MSVVPSRSLKLLIALVLLLQLPSNAAWGQETDKTAAALEADRLKYENSLEVIRREVRAEIAQLYKKATREDDPVAARERVEAIEAAFESRGTLPEHKKENTWAKNYNAQKDQLERAYAQAIERYRAAGNEALVEALSAEQELFAKQLDLVPWGANLIESPVEVGANKPLEIEADIKGEYRIEIRATRIEGGGTLWVELPVSDQRRVRVPMVTGSDGSVRAILTVTPELVSADASAVRPVDIGGAMVGVDKSIGLEADASSFSVSQIALKPLMQGELVVDGPGRNRPGGRDPAEKEQRATAADLMPVGSEWVGTLYGDLAGERTANAKVIRHNGSNVELDVTDKHGTYRWTLSFDGDRFRVTKVLGIRPADLSVITQVNIEGRVRERQLECNGKWLVQNKARGGGGGAGVRMELDRK